MKTEQYDIYFGVLDDYLHLEAFPEGELEHSHHLKIPMTKLYHEEIAYALELEKWSEKDLEGFTDKKPIGEFIKADMPKLLAWWSEFLPRPKRRK
jgi:hypothetical protein